MYQSIWELPTSVLNCLNEEDATKWMTTYNECNPESTDDVRQAKRKAWHSVAKAPSSFSFEIIASTDTIDRAKDIIDLDSTKKHMDSFIDFGGNIQNDHHNYTVGTIWDWKPCKVKDDRGNEVDGIITYGNLFGGDLVYDKIRRSFVNGMNKLSIAGEAAPGKYQCDERGCYTRRNVQQLLEISLCVEPMNKYCTLVDYNKDATFTKSTSAVNFKIQEYIIHKDQSVCPIMSLKKSLQSIGYDEVHAKEDGVHIPMSREEFEATLPIMHRNGLVARYYKGEAIIHRRDEILEQAFKRSIASGFCSADGSLSATIPRHVFSEYLEYGIIDKDAFGGYGFVKSDDEEMEFIHAIKPTKTEIIERMKADPTYTGFDPETYTNGMKMDVGKSSKNVLYAAPFRNEIFLSDHHKYDGMPYTDTDGIIRGFMFRWPKSDINMAESSEDVKELMDRMTKGTSLSKKGELRGDEFLLRLQPEDIEQFSKMLRPFAYDTRSKKFITGGPFRRSLDTWGLTFEKPKPTQEQKTEEPKKELAKPQTQTGIGTQPGEPPMMVKYEDTAEGRADMLGRIDEAMKKFYKLQDKYKGKFYAEKIFNKVRSRPVKFKTLQEQLDWYNDINDDFERAGREAYRAWARRR